MQFSTSLSIIGKWVALISFILGSIIFGVYYQSGRSEFLNIAYSFIIAAAVTNICILILLLSTAKKNKVNRKQLLVSAGVVIGNIPIMITYCIVGLTIMSYMRITFNNSTNQTLHNVEIVGCENKIIEQLESGHMTSVWVKIPSDCGIKIHYRLNEEAFNETVYPYTTPRGGQVLYHRIGGSNDRQ